MNHETILVAEDDASSCEMLVELLTLGNYDTQVAASADACVDALRTQRFAAVLLDLSLPGMSQSELIAALKLLPERSPVIVFSARTVEEVRSVAAQLGAAAVLPKPADIDQILATVGRVARAPH